MADDRPSFSWWHRQTHEKCEKIGPFTFAEIQPLLRRVAESDCSLLMSLPQMNLDFTATEPGEMEMEIQEDGGWHIGLVTGGQGEEVARRALADCEGGVLRSKLSDLPIQWLTDAETPNQAMQRTADPL